MMYSEFIEGTGCKDNVKNYEVFCNLEVMYMNTNMTKAQIYEYGKKLVDNSKSEAELALEKKVNSEIQTLNQEIEWNKEEIKRLKWYLEGICTKEEERKYRSRINYLNDKNRHYRTAIRSLKWVLE